MAAPTAADIFNITLPPVDGDIQAGIAILGDKSNPRWQWLSVPDELPVNKKVVSAVCSAYDICLEITNRERGSVTAATIKEDPVIRAILGAVAGGIRSGLICKRDANTADGDVILQGLQTPSLTEAEVMSYISSENMSTGLTLALATKVSFWTTNHHTGQGDFTTYVKKAVGVVLGQLKNPVKDYKTFVHALGHWFSTRKCMEVFGLQNIIKTVPLDKVVEGRLSKIQVTEDVAMRMRAMPAGTAKHAICFHAAKNFRQSPLMTAFPRMADLVNLIEEVSSLNASNKAYYHVGAHYLTGKDKRDLKSVALVGTIGSMVYNLAPSSTLRKSPHITRGEEKAYATADDYAEDWEGVCSQYAQSNVIISGSAVSRLAGSTTVGVANKDVYMSLFAAFKGETLTDEEMKSATARYAAAMAAVTAPEESFLEPGN